MKKRLTTRLLSLLLVAALLIGMMPTASAVSPKSDVTVTQVDNSAVSVNPLNRDDEELHTMDEYLDHEIVRVSIVLEKASTIKAGFSTMDIADNKAAMAYRADLKEEQVSMVQRIEKATGKEEKLALLEAKARRADEAQAVAGDKTQSAEERMRKIKEIFGLN